MLQQSPDTSLWAEQQGTAPEWSLRMKTWLTETSNDLVAPMSWLLGGSTKIWSTRTVPRGHMSVESIIWAFRSLCIMFHIDRSAKWDVLSAVFTCSLDGPTCRAVKSLFRLCCCSWTSESQCRNNMDATAGRGCCCWNSRSVRLTSQWKFRFLKLFEALYSTRFCPILFDVRVRSQKKTKILFYQTCYQV